VAAGALPAADSAKPISRKRSPAGNHLHGRTFHFPAKPPLGVFTIGLNSEYKVFRLRRNIHSAGELTHHINIIMGDKSPKSVQKKATQKQKTTDAASDKKRSLITAQQATKAKAAANKKK
jgi:hypothetical protein